MGILEILLISIGLSFDVFVVHIFLFFNRLFFRIFYTIENSIFC